MHDSDTGSEDVYVLVQELARTCTKAGLNATVVSPTRVCVSLPGAGRRSVETIRCMPDEQERLMWWGWGEPICPASHISDAVKMICHVLAPRSSSDRMENGTPARKSPVQ
jgi:hypothetical protein